jgi:hypothetical protein
MACAGDLQSAKGTLFSGMHTEEREQLGERRTYCVCEHFARASRPRPSRLAPDESLRDLR